MTLVRSSISNSSLVALFIATLIIHAILIDNTTPRKTAQLSQFIFGECGPKAAKSGDCYYLRDNIRYANEPVDFTDQIAAVADFNRQLKERNIRLLVVPIPSKISIKWNSHTVSFIEELRHIDIEVIELKLDRQSYLRTDTHWNHSGIDHAAREIAQRLGSVERVSGEDMLTYRYGDIIKMLENQTIKNIVGQEPTTCEQFDLQQDTNDVLFIGDSYLRIFELDEPGDAGLISMVGAYLGYRPRSIVNDGGGSTLVRQRLAREPGLLQDTKVVVWVFADRDIKFGVDGWQQITLPQLDY